jgi:U3 small nucleolar ribonucleoprotein component
MSFKLVHNVETDEVSEVDLSEQEITQIELDKQIKIAEDALAASKAIQKAELLTKLGITADEAALLLG